MGCSGYIFYCNTCEKRYETPYCSWGDGSAVKKLKELHRDCDTGYHFIEVYEKREGNDLVLMSEGDGEEYHRVEGFFKYKYYDLTDPEVFESYKNGKGANR